MTTPTTTREAEAYLAEVREQLNDLGDEERAELLQDLAQHLTEISSDETNPEADLRKLLGTPSDYAAELRSAAGLPPREPGPTETKPRPAFADRLLPLWNHRWARAGRAISRDLAPAWWIVRGYLVAVLPFWIDPFGSSSEDFPVPRYQGEPLLGAAAIVIGVAASVLLGRWGRRSPQLGRAAGLIALNALVLLAAANAYGAVRAQYVVFSQSQLHQVSELSRQVGELSTSLESPYGTVTNIYPYDSLGNPLENVLLFDQDGRPLRAGKQEWWADGCTRAPAHPHAADGVPVAFSYPVEYRVELQSGTQVDTRCLQLIPRPPVPIPTFPN